MTNAEIFIEKYKQLEEAVRSAYNLRNEDSISYYLTRHDKYRKYIDEIKYCKEVRNLLSHKKKLENNFAVEPNDNMLSFIDDLIEKVRNRRKCRDIHITLSSVYWQPLCGKVIDTVNAMHQKSYRFAPILDKNGVVAGVFGVDSLFSYIADNTIASVNEELRFSDIMDYISLDARKPEKIVFVKADSYADELEERIELNYKNGVRTELALVTANANKNEKLQGIITPWNIINL